MLLTDAYRRKPHLASYAATRLYWRAMQIQDDLERTERAPKGGGRK